MSSIFLQPNFSTGDIELRIEDEEVCIYATDVGLKKLILFCESLREEGRNNHIHLGDYDVLTKESLNGVIAKL